MVNDSVFNKFPELIVNDEIILRDFMAEDVEHYFQLLHHPAVKSYIPDDFLPKNLAACTQELQYLRSLFLNRTSLYWAIAKRSDNKMIGTCGFEQWLKRHNRMELAYELHPDYWRQGIASLSVKAVVDFGFTHMKANRIDAYCLSYNIASMKLLIGLGFQQEGILRQFRHFNGKYRDIILFGLLNTDQERNQGKWVRNLLNRWR